MRKSTEDALRWFLRQELLTEDFALQSREVGLIKDARGNDENAAHTLNLSRLRRQQIRGILENMDEEERDKS